ncbi:MAG: PTS system mannose/fructose/sorbose family transporter subunit IID [Bacillota bacterium]|nr:PTS system mannose/fructose/sorbose family transporter subunit IID [Bacillota bacterium]
MVSSEIKVRNHLTKQDINKMATRAIMLQSNYNYERQQGTGFAASIAPTLKKIYGDDVKGLGQSLKWHTKFLNTTPVVSTFIMGVVASMEEANAPLETVNSVKNSLFGPLAGIGDTIIWYTALPLAAAIGASIAKNGSALGALIYVLIMTAANCLRWPGAHLGYHTGVAGISKLNARLGKISTAATMLGVTVLGALIASYVSLKFTITIPLSASYSFDLQKDFFDHIFPNLVPAIVTFVIFTLYKKKGVKPTKLILLLIAAGILMSLLGIA